VRKKPGSACHSPCAAWRRGKSLIRRGEFLPAPASVVTTGHAAGGSRGQPSTLSELVRIGLPGQVGERKPGMSGGRTAPVMAAAGDLCRGEGGIKRGC